MEMPKDFASALNMAAKMKSEQPEVKRRRKRWDSTPKFLRATLTAKYSDDEKLRSTDTPIAEKLEAATKWREEANRKYHEATGTSADHVSQENGQTMLEAIDGYTRAAGVFLYCKRVRDKDGDDIVRVNNFSGLKDKKDVTAEQVEAVTELMVACYSNLSACYLKLADYHACIDACKEVLQINSNHVKALYRCAKAYDAVDELEKALEYLRRAKKVAPQNPLVSADLARLKKERTAQRERDERTFSGMFNRGSLYDDKAAQSRAAAGPSSQSSSEQQDDLGLSDLTQEDLEMSKEEREFLQNYVRNDPHFQGDKNNPFLEIIRMKAGAKKYGLDLTDPVVQRELRALQQKGPQGLKELQESLEAEEAKEKAPVNSSWAGKCKRAALRTVQFILYLFLLLMGIRITLRIVRMFTGTQTPGTP